MRVALVKICVYAYTSAPGKREVEFTWTDMDPGPGTSYYHVRRQQKDGELVWISPREIQYKS